MDKIKYYYITILGSIISYIGLSFYITERNYADSDRRCRITSCLAEALQPIGIAIFLTGISTILISLLLKDN